jgi:photosystem II stability/assembly factor-like uncharacterized protein
MKRRHPPRQRSAWAWLLGVAIGAAVVAGATLWWLSSSGSDAPTAWARLGTADVHALTFDPVDSDRLLFGHHDGLLATSDGGRSWEPTTLTGSDAMNVARLSSERLQIAGHDVYLESTDGGASWAPVPNDLPGQDLHAFAVDPADSDRAWAFAVGHGLFRTGNAGRDWELLDPNNWGALTAYRRDGVTVLAAIGPEGLVRSRDGGMTWEPMAYPGAPLAAMAAAPDGRVLYAATAAGIRKSTDEGATWSDTGFPLQALALAVSPKDPNVIAAVDEQTRFYRSSDGGTTWPASGS